MATNSDISHMLCVSHQGLWQYSASYNPGDLVYDIEIQYDIFGKLLDRITRAYPKKLRHTNLYMRLLSMRDSRSQPPIPKTYICKNHITSSLLPPGARGNPEFFESDWQQIEVLDAFYVFDEDECRVYSKTEN